MDQRNNNEFDILLIDNRDISRMTTYNILSNSGYKVDMAYHGKDGILKLKENHFVYKLVITEVIMPYASGFEVIEYVKNNSKIPVMVLSSINDERTIESIYSINTDEVVKKPFMITDLIQKVKRLVSTAPKAPSYMTAKTPSYFEPKVSPATLGLLDELEPPYNPPPSVNLNPIEILPYVKPKSTRRNSKEESKQENAKKATAKSVTVSKKDASKSKSSKDVNKTASMKTVVPKAKTKSAKEKNEKNIEPKANVRKTTASPKEKIVSSKTAAKTSTNPTRKVTTTTKAKSKDQATKAKAVKKTATRKDAISSILVESPKKISAKPKVSKKSSDNTKTVKPKVAAKSTSAKTTTKAITSIKVKSPLVKPVSSKLKKETASTSKKQKATR